MDVESLVSAVFERPAIWDASEKSHSDRNIIKKLWDEIAEDLNCDAEIAKKKFKGLKDTFRKELRKVPKGKSGDAGLPEDQYQSTWPHFKQMFFLKDQVIGRASSGNLSTLATQENDYELDNMVPALSDKFLIPSPSSPCSGSASVAKGRSNKRKIPSSFELQQQMLEIEREKLKALTNPNFASSADDSDNDVKLFCLNLVPKIKKLSPDNQSLFCLKVQEMLHNYLYPPMIQAPGPHVISPRVPYYTSSIAPPAPYYTSPIAPPAPYATSPIALPVPYSTSPIAPPVTYSTSPIALPVPYSTSPIAPPVTYSTRPIAPPASYSTSPIAPPAPYSTRPIAPPAPYSTRPIAPPAPYSTRPIAPHVPYSTSSISPRVPYSTRPIEPPASTSPIAPHASYSSSPIAPPVPYSTSSNSPPVPTSSGSNDYDTFSMSNYS